MKKEIDLQIKDLETGLIDYFSNVNPCKEKLSEVNRLIELNNTRKLALYTKSKARKILVGKIKNVS